VEGALVFALGQHGDLVCLEASSGNEKWRKSFHKDFAGRVGGWGYAESPLVDGEQVVCTPGSPQGTVWALKTRTGEVVWQSKDFTDRADYSSLVMATMDGVKQYVQLTDSSVAGVAADDGRLLWRVERLGKTAVIPTPIVRDNYVYVTSGYGVGCNLFMVTSTGGQFKAEEVYANKVMANHHGGVVLLGENVYGYSDGKGWVCQDFKTGQMVWSSRKLEKGSLVFAEGHLYLRSESESGTVALIEATPAGWKENSRFDQPERSTQNSWPHPVVAGGRLYLRDQDWLLCYDLKEK
jgi:outer membrane protein assembly factor BamB